MSAYSARAESFFLFLNRAFWCCFNTSKRGANYSKNVYEISNFVSDFCDSGNLSLISVISENLSVISVISGNLPLISVISVISVILLCVFLVLKMCFAVFFPTFRNFD